MESREATSHSSNTTTTASSNVQTLVVPIPPEDVGRLIGKQGVQVRVIREQAGCDISVHTSDRARPVARLKGTPETLAIAKALIASICGGEGVKFIRDLDELSTMCLTRQQWLKQEQEKYHVTTEFKGRHLKIISQNGLTAPAQQFKQTVETYIKHQTERVTEHIPCPCDPAAILKRLRDNNELRVLEQCCVQQPLLIDIDPQGRLCLRGPRVAVDDACSIVESVINDLIPPPERVRQHLKSACIPVIPRLCEGASAKKMEDFNADIQEGIVEKYHVIVHYTPGASQCVIEGHYEDDVLYAQMEMELLIRYYFHKSCALIPVPQDGAMRTAQALALCEQQAASCFNGGSAPACLLAPLTQRPDEVCCAVRTTPQGSLIWICGLANAMDAAIQGVFAFLEAIECHLPYTVPSSALRGNSGSCPANPTENGSRGVNDASGRGLKTTDVE